MLMDGGGGEGSLFFWFGICLINDNGRSKYMVVIKMGYKIIFYHR
jgi:hypothetical protein